MSDFERKMGKAALGTVAGIGIGGAGAGIVENQRKLNEDKKEEDTKRMKEKFKVEDEPSGAGKESLSKSQNYKKGGSVSSASRRADGAAQRGKTRGRMV